MGPGAGAGAGAGAGGAHAVHAGVQGKACGRSWCTWWPMTCCLAMRRLPLRHWEDDMMSHEDRVAERRRAQMVLALLVAAQGGRWRFLEGSRRRCAPS